MEMLSPVRCRRATSGEGMASFATCEKDFERIRAWWWIILVLEPAEEAGSDSVYHRVGLGSLGRRIVEGVLQEQECKFDLSKRRTITLV